MMRTTSTETPALLLGTPEPCRRCGHTIRVCCVVATGKWVVTEDFPDDAEQVHLHHCGVQR